MAFQRNATETELGITIVFFEIVFTTTLPRRPVVKMTQLRVVEITRPIRDVISSSANIRIERKTRQLLTGHWKCVSTTATVLKFANMF